jgi:hypothetical protein
VGGDEDNARAQHQQCADYQCALASDTVSGGGEPERNARIAHEGEGEEQADLLFGKADLREIKREDDREEAVAKESNDARGEKNDNVAIHFYRHGFQSLNRSVFHFDPQSTRSPQSHYISLCALYALRRSISRWDYRPSRFHSRLPQNFPTGLFSMKKRTPETAGIPFRIKMVPKAGFEPALVSPPPPQAAPPLMMHYNPFVCRIVTAMPKYHIP